MIRLHRPKGLPMSRIARLVLAFVLVGFSVSLLVEPQSPLAQQKPKLRPLRVALPSHTIAATHFYVGKSLGIFESHGFEPQILVLEPRAALRGVPVRVIMVGLNRPDHVLVASEQINSVEQLRGKVLGGYTAQATVNTILIELLRRRGLKPDEYKILNVGTARLAALTAGNVPAAVLNGLETVKAVRQGFRPLARAADEIELATGGLGTSVATIQSKREIFRSVVQAVLESIRISATQKERVLPVLMKQFAIPQEDANLILDIVHK